jgi:iron complex outermembrane receptor protein
MRVGSRTATGPGARTPRRNRLLWALPFAAGFVEIMAQSPVSAQTVARPAAQATVEEVIVTAEKKAQTLEKAPASITAFSSDMLANRQLNTISDLGTQVPNLYFAETNGVEEVGIRGVSINTTNPQIDPVISLNLDGVYQPRITSMNLLLSDLDSIEVLRGPQGTLYGRNATGGVINVITAKPTDTFQASASALGGNYDRYMFKGFVSGPLAEGVEMRLSGMVDNREGYGENLFTGSHGDSREWSAKAALRFRPTSNILVDLSVYHLGVSTVGAETYPVTPIGGPNITVLPPEEQVSTDEPWKYFGGINGHSSTEQTGATGTITWQGPYGLQLKSISGYVHSHYKDQYDSDGTPADLIVIQSDYPSTMFSEEIDLNATFKRLDAVAGLYYSHEKVDNHSFDVFRLGIPGFGVPPFNEDIDMPQVATSKAVFADLTYHLTDRLRLEGGVRQTSDETSVRQTVNVIGLGGFTCDALPGQLNNDSTTGRVGAQFDVAPTTMAYGQWQSGFKAGGYNFSICGNQYQPETIQAWEGGVKGRYFDGRLSIRLAGFYYDYSNMQVQEVTGISSSISNAGKSTLYGAEFEGSAKMGRSLSLDWGLTWLHTRYVNFVSINTALPQPSPVENLAGNTLVMAPDYTIRVGANYVVPLGPAGDLTFRGEIFHSDTVYFTPFDEDISKQSPYTLVNLFLTYRPVGGRLELMGFVKNVGNTAYQVSGYTLGAFFPNSGYGMWGDPRTYGLQLTARY